MLLTNVEAISQKAKIDFERADKTLVSFYCDVDSNRSAQGVDGWNGVQKAAAGAVVGAGLGAIGK